MGAIGPVSGWPERYTAAVAMTVVQLKAERQTMDARIRESDNG